MSRTFTVLKITFTPLLPQRKNFDSVRRMAEENGRFTIFQIYYRHFRRDRSSYSDRWFEIKEVFTGCAPHLLTPDQKSKRLGCFWVAHGG